MSFLTTLPDLLLAAAGQLQSIGSAVTAANSTAAFSITGVVPAAADEVSVVTAATFAGYGQHYQAISAEASMIHEQFVSALGLSADSYAATEAANATQAAGGHLPPAHMVPVAPARPAPAAPARVSPPAPRRVTPPAPGRSTPGTPIGAGTAAPGPLTATTSAGAGWQGGGGYGRGNYGHMTPQRGGYANANYGGHTTPRHGGYANANYGGHPAHAARVDAPDLAAGQHISPSQLAPTAPVHRESLAAAIPAEKVLPMHLPAGMPGEHVVQAHAALKAAAGPKPLPALA